MFHSQGWERLCHLSDLTRGPPVPLLEGPSVGVFPMTGQPVYKESIHARRSIRIAYQPAAHLAMCERRDEKFCPLFDLTPILPLP